MFIYIYIFLCVCVSFLFASLAWKRWWGVIHTRNERISSCNNSYSSRPWRGWQFDRNGDLPQRNRFTRLLHLLRVRHVLRLCFLLPNYDSFFSFLSIFILFLFFFLLFRRVSTKFIVDASGGLIYLLLLSRYSFRIWFIVAWCRNIWFAVYWLLKCLELKICFHSDFIMITLIFYDCKFFVMFFGLNYHYNYHFTSLSL